MLNVRYVDVPTTKTNTKYSMNNRQYKRQDFEGDTIIGSTDKKRIKWQQRKC